DEYGLEVLARPASRAPVHVTLETVLETQTGSAQDLRVEVAPVVDDDADGRPQVQRRSHVAKDGGDPIDVLGDRTPARAAGRATELSVSTLVQPEQLVRVPVLLVIVDQPRVGRRRDDAVVRTAQVEIACISVHDLGDAALDACRRERLDP